MLITIEGVLSPDELGRVRARLEEAPWCDGAASAGSLARQVKHNQQLAEDSELAQQLSGDILRRVSAHPLFVSAALPLKIFPPRFNRYAGGGAYGAHVDSAVMRLPGDGGALRSDLSATLFLSGPAEYDGGELEIEGAYGVQEIKLAAGDLVLYPSTSLHRVTPVTRGARLASFFWIESLVADEGARTLLFDLDQSIQALQSVAPALPASDSRLLKLTGIYHNLLRRWAIT